MKKRINIVSQSMDTSSMALSRYRVIKTETGYSGGYGSATGIMITHTSPLVFYLSLPEHKLVLTRYDSSIKIPS